VQEAIESVLDQTFDDVEVIVVDDGSTDGTGEVLRNRYDARVQYLHQANSGRSVARSRGIMASTGRYLLFLDSDDLLLPQALEHEVAFLEAHPEVDVVYTDGYFCDEAGRNASRIAPARPAHSLDNLLEDLVISNVILACHSVMVRRAALDAVAPPYFDKALRGTEDEDLWIRLAAQGSAFAYLDVPTCKYRVHGSNASRYDPSSPVFWKRQESVKRSRLKVLNAEFFSRLRAETREQFLYKMLLFELEGDEATRESVLNSASFKELAPAERARLLYYLGVRNIVTDRELALGRSRLREAMHLRPKSLKYRSILLLAYLGRPLLSCVIKARRWLNRIGRKHIPASPIGQGGLHPV
jgi:glycosyltransferase involved in cell wall biosynthesis